MIPTSLFLVFAMLPIACLMVQQLPYGCINVKFESFLGTGNKTTLPNALGLYCKNYYSTKGLEGAWIGTAGQGISQCLICCIRRDKEGLLHYNVTTAPRKFPCGKGKECNRRQCVNKNKKVKTNNQG
uniref:Putative ixostatin n=1 Tax=Ixodes ricinus TaxID=34613 RepID=A0A0K8RB23_IXORI